MQKTLLSEELEQVLQAVKESFITPKRTRALICKWKFFILKGIIAQKVTKSPSAYLELLIKKLSDIQTSLSPKYRNETIFRDKLSNTVKDVSSRQLAYHKPDDTVQSVISDLNSSLATSIKNKLFKIPDSPSALFVDLLFIIRSNSRFGSLGATHELEINIVRKIASIVGDLIPGRQTVHQRSASQHTKRASPFAISWPQFRLTNSQATKKGLLLM